MARLVPPAWRGLVNPVFLCGSAIGVRLPPDWAGLTLPALFLTRFCFFLLRLLAGFDGRLPYQPPCARFFSPVLDPFASN